MSTPEAGSGFGLGPIDQVAFVVADLEAALPRYTALYGPFHVPYRSGVHGL